MSLPPWPVGNSWVVSWSPTCHFMQMREESTPTTHKWEVLPFCQSAESHHPLPIFSLIWWGNICKRCGHSFEVWAVCNIDNHGHLWSLEHRHPSCPSFFILHLYHWYNLYNRDFLPLSLWSFVSIEAPSAFSVIFSSLLASGILNIGWESNNFASLFKCQLKIDVFVCLFVVCVFRKKCKVCRWLFSLHSLESNYCKCCNYCNDCKGPTHRRCLASSLLHCQLPRYSIQCSLGKKLAPPTALGTERISCQTI